MKGTSRKGKGRRIFIEPRAEGAGRTAQRGTEKRNSLNKEREQKKQATERKGTTAKENGRTLKRCRSSSDQDAAPSNYPWPFPEIYACGMN